jgi:hypothetical protein
MNPETDNLKSSLLSKSELQWLRSDLKVSKSFEYKLKRNIKRKIHTFTELELPLLVKNYFIASENDDQIDDGLKRDLGLGLSPIHDSDQNSDLVRQRSLW